MRADSAYRAALSPTTAQLDAGWIFSDLTASGDFLPPSDGVNSLGSTGARWRDITAAGKISTTSIREQARLGYDADNYWTLTVDSGGATSYNVVGSNPGHILKLAGLSRFVLTESGGFAFGLDCAINGNLYATSQVRCSLFRLDQSATASGDIPTTHKVVVSINGAEYFMLLSNV